MRVYAKCMTGLEGVWIGRMNDVLSHAGISDHRWLSYFASSARYSRCSRWAPPVGFEPTHTAPEAADPICRIVELTWEVRHRQLYRLRGDSAHIPDHACWEVVTSVFLRPCCQMPIALLGGRAGWLVNGA